jgi:sulfoxide reductase heme-binding subunit YedZ
VGSFAQSANLFIPSPCSNSFVRTQTSKSIQQTRQTRRLVQHHLPLAFATIAAVAVLYSTRPYRDWISRASFATAYPALVLLAITLWIGPWNLLRARRTPVSTDLRRDIGIWAAIVGLTHAIVGQCVHLRGRPWLYYVYDNSGHLLPFRHDLFGWANYTGLFGSLILLALVATSNDLALRALGTRNGSSSSAGTTPASLSPQSIRCSIRPLKSCTDPSSFSPFSAPASRYSSSSPAWLGRKTCQAPLNPNHLISKQIALK